MNFTPAPPGWTAHYTPDTYRVIAGWIQMTPHTPEHIVAVTHDGNGYLERACDFTDFCCITGPGQPPHTTTDNTHQTRRAPLPGEQWCDRCDDYTSGSHWHCAKCGQRSSMIGHAGPCPTPSDQAEPGQSITPNTLR